MSIDTDAGTGAVLELEIASIGHGGVFIARHDGRVVLVRHALPGERVRAQITEDKGGSFARAETIEVLRASPDRIDPLCPHGGVGGAGCCDLSHASPEAQRRLKTEVLRGQLAHLAGIDEPVEVAPLGDGAVTGWRTRARLAVDARGRLGRRGYRSTRVVPGTECAQFATGLVDGLGRYEFTPGAEVLVVLDDDGDRHVVELAPARPRRGGRGGSRRATAARRAAAAGPRRARTIEGDGQVVRRVAGRTWSLDPRGFWQAHRDAPAAYRTQVADWAPPTPGGTAWDLYGGAGVLAVPLAGAVGGAGQVTVVESAPQSLDAGRAALTDQPQIGFVAARVERFLADHGSDGAELIVLDPPRSGAGAEVARAVAAAARGPVIHIGCDPAAFARDLGLYRREGMAVQGLRAFDAFPLTHHFEALALLTP